MWYLLRKVTRRVLRPRMQIGGIRELFGTDVACNVRTLIMNDG